MRRGVGGFSTVTGAQLGRRRTAALLLAVLLPAGCVQAPDPAAFPQAEDLPTVATPTEVAQVPMVGATLSAGLRAHSVERRAREMTVRIRATGCGALGTGSGFAVGEGVIVTNRHVIEDANTISLNTWDGSSFDASVQGIEYTDDLALVRTGRRLPLAGQLASDDPNTGEDVTVVGYPLGGQQELAPGRVVDYARLDTDEGPRVLRLSAEIWPGNSGGPVLDSTGRVVGVVFAIERATDYALAVPVSHLHEVLAEGAAQAGPLGCRS